MSNNSNSNADKLAFERIRQWLNKSCGMHYPERKQALLEQRLRRVCNAENFSSFEELADVLEQGHSFDVQSTVISAAATNHTYFFREPLVLNYFRDVILPALGNEARIWSAAASTGDEAYTIAIIAAEAKGIEWVKNNLSILGTDIDKHVIAHAEKGIYRENALENTPDLIIRHYFDALNNGQYRVNKHLCRACTFRRLNLKTQPYPFNNKFDVVFCRNVLYYFDEVHQKQVLENIYDVTKQGGWLITSVTVSLRHLNTRWVNIVGSVYRKL